MIKLFLQILQSAEINHRKNVPKYKNMKFIPYVKISWVTLMKIFKLSVGHTAKN